MNFKTEADTVRALAKIVANGHLHKGFKPVYWSVVGASAMAETEVEYRDKTSNAIDVAYPLIDAPAWLTRFGNPELSEAPSLVIWTTTPWTLPASLAISVGEEIEYSLVQVAAEEHQRYLIVAAELMDALAERSGMKLVEVARCMGRSLVGLSCQHPFYAERVIPLLAGEHVTLETGTGAVHTAPDHGVEDFQVCQSNGIATLNPLDDHGIFREHVALVGGLHVYKADARVIEILREHRALISHATFQHSYPHCWRTKSPLIYRATPQWFISMDQNRLKATALDLIPSVRWVPDWGQNRIEAMVRQSPDWCISRQRTWGTPIPFFVHRESGDLHPDTPALLEKVAEHIEAEGIDVWWSLSAESLLGPDAALYEKVTDTMDVWFDSGVTHFSVLQQRAELQQYPADLYLEGSDQHRGWFQSSLKTAVAIHGSAPYRQVLTHGFTVDEQGYKMSKSSGNGIAPQEITEEMGADILRLWVSATDYSAEMAMSRNILKRTADSYRRIRNTVRFLLSNMAGFDPSLHAVPADEMISLDRWIVARTRGLQEEIAAAYEQYHFVQAYQKIHNFCAGELGGFYLDIIKDRQYTTPAESLARRSAQTALCHIAEALVRWCAPILSFTAEEIWQHLPPVLPGGEPRGESVFLSTFHSDWQQIKEDPDTDDAYWSRVLDIRRSVNKALEDARNQGVAKKGGSLATAITLYIDEPDRQLLERLDEELRFVMLTSAVTLLPLAEAPAHALEGELPGLKIVVAESAHKKCERCWHRRPEVGAIAEFPDLCQRCVDNIQGPGEQRRFA